MTKLESFLDKIKITRADHLPVIAAFCRHIDLVETINRVVPNEMDVSVGVIIQGMVLDILSGRSPLYRLADFFEHQDTELLLGETVDSTSFNDTTVARAMDAIFNKGAEKVFSAVAFRSSCKFPLDNRYVHFDTTSVNVWGDYDQRSSDSKNLNITFGYSKDHRPDLKQFLIKMLCVSGNIPILGSCEDGNRSDKTINNTVLSKISKHMATRGLEPGAFIYVADSAVVTEDNLTVVGDNLLLTRLPLNYNETSRVISEAIDENNWTGIGILNETPTTPKRPPATYRIAEKTLVLYKKEYRAVVVHSSAHDKRRTKRIEREVKTSIKTISKTISQETKQEYYCLADAHVAGSRLSASGTDLHDISVSIEEKIRYCRGRPAKNGTRRVNRICYILKAKIEEKVERIKRKQEEAGCFVLLTNVPIQGEMAETGADLLRVYKEQNGIERNFSFLKDPLIVNDLFLKKPERIEALGAILLIALLVRNLIEHQMRQYLSGKTVQLPGWDKKPTRRPTAFMMGTKFLGITIVSIAGVRKLTAPLNEIQGQYLKALNLSREDLLNNNRQINSS